MGGQPRPLSNRLRVTSLEEFFQRNAAVAHFDLASGPPILGGAIPVKLDAILIWIAQVDREADVMISDVVDLDGSGNNASACCLQVGKVSIDRGKMIEAGRASWGR